MLDSHHPPNPSQYHKTICVFRWVEHLSRTARWVLDALFGEPGAALAVSAALDLLAIAPTEPWAAGP